MKVTIRKDKDVWYLPWMVVRWESKYAEYYRFSTWKKAMDFVFGKS